MHVGYISSNMDIIWDETSNRMSVNQFQIAPREIKVKDLGCSFFDKKSYNEMKNQVLYYIFDNIADENTFSLFEEENIKHEMIVIPPLKIVKEFAKTAGYYNSKVSKVNMTFPEVYEVISGTAHCLMQSMAFDGFVDVIAMEAHVGEKIIMPPGYGVVMINPENETLMVSKFVSRNSVQNFETMKSKGGASYFEILDIDGKKYIANDSYKFIPEIRYMKKLDLEEIGMDMSASLYKLFSEDVKTFEFLSKPQNYGWLFNTIKA
jgi:glucose-6-phosphate isomerase